MAGQDEQVEARVAALTRARWVPADPGDADAEHDGDDLRGRALRVALESYVAAHGHPLDHAAGPAPGRRWLPSRRVVLAAAAVLALVTAVVVGRSLLTVPSTVLTGSDGPTSAGASGAAPAQPGSGQDTSGAEADPRARGVDDGAAGGGAEGSTIVAHVVGAVAEPGLVELPAGARVAEALEAAGGPTAEADLTAVNLARTVVDGEQIHVPLPGEEPPVVQPGATAGAAPGGAAPVDLNHADAAALEALPGVGPVLAERIVAWRDEHGPFRSVDELTEVSGIGPAVLEQLRDHARAG